jgi:hypothetical protein
MTEVHPEPLQWADAMEEDKLAMDAVCEVYRSGVTNGVAIDPLTPDEQDVLEVGRKFFLQFSVMGYAASGSTDEAKSRTIKLKKLRTTHTGTKLAVLCEHATDENGQFVARVQATIRAPAEAIVAYNMVINKNYSYALVADDDDIIGETVFDRTVRQTMTRRAYEFHVPLFKKREFLVRCAWEKISDAEYFFAYTSVRHPSYPATNEFVRMDVTQAMVIKQITAETTSVTSAYTLKLGGVVSTQVSNAVVLPTSTSGLISMKAYFSATRDPQQHCGVHDAEELGVIVAFTLCPLGGDPMALRKGINKLLKRNASLRSVHVKYEWFDELLFHMIRNKVSVTTKANANSLLATFTRADASETGGALPVLLLSSVSASAAVDEWIRSSAALGLLVAEFEWIRPLFDAIVEGVLSTATFGATFRMYFGAGTSVMDMLSDLYIAASYIEEGRGALAYLLIGMIATNFILQVLVVYFATTGLKEDRWEAFTTDVLYVVTCLKPGVRDRIIIPLRTQPTNDEYIYNSFLLRLTRTESPRVSNRGLDRRLRRCRKWSCPRAPRCLPRPSPALSFKSWR